MQDVKATVPYQEDEGMNGSMLLFQNISIMRHHCLSSLWNGLFISADWRKTIDTLCIVEAAKDTPPQNYHYNTRTFHLLQELKIIDEDVELNGRLLNSQVT